MTGSTDWRVRAKHTCEAYTLPSPPESRRFPVEHNFLIIGYILRLTFFAISFLKKMFRSRQIRPYIIIIMPAWNHSSKRGLYLLIV